MSFADVRLQTMDLHPNNIVVYPPSLNILPTMSTIDCRSGKSENGEKISCTNITSCATSSGADNSDTFYPPNCEPISDTDEDDVFLPTNCAIPRRTKIRAVCPDNLLPRACATSCSLQRFPRLKSIASLSSKDARSVLDEQFRLVAEMNVLRFGNSMRSWMHPLTGGDIKAQDKESDLQECGIFHTSNATVPEACHSSVEVNGHSQTTGMSPSSASSPQEFYSHSTANSLPNSVSSTVTDKDKEQIDESTPCQSRIHDVSSSPPITAEVSEDKHSPELPRLPESDTEYSYSREDSHDGQRMLLKTKSGFDCTWQFKESEEILPADKDVLNNDTCPSRNSFSETGVKEVQLLKYITCKNLSQLEYENAKVTDPLKRSKLHLQAQTDYYTKNFSTGDLNSEKKLHSQDSKPLCDKSIAVPLPIVALQNVQTDISFLSADVNKGSEGPDVLQSRCSEPREDMPPNPSLHQEDVDGAVSPVCSLKCSASYSGDEAEDPGNLIGDSGTEYEIDNEADVSGISIDYEDGITGHFEMNVSKNFKSHSVSKHRRAISDISSASSSSENFSELDLDKSTKRNISMKKTNLGDASFVENSSTFDDIANEAEFFHAQFLESAAENKTITSDISEQGRRNYSTGINSDGSPCLHSEESCSEVFNKMTDRRRNTFQNGNKVYNQSEKFLQSKHTCCIETADSRYEDASSHEYNDDENNDNKCVNDTYDDLVRDSKNRDRGEINILVPGIPLELKELCSNTANDQDSSKNEVSGVSGTSLDSESDECSGATEDPAGKIGDVMDTQDIFEKATAPSNTVTFAINKHTFVQQNHCCRRVKLTN